MSPPLAEMDSETPVKRKKTMTPAALLANQTNGRLSRGPGAEAKKRTRYNASKHNLRAESELLPGEDGAELRRRLDVWPELMNAQDELQVLVAQRVVHMGWRMERAERSEDADTQRRTLGIAQAAEDQRAEQARLLGLELDSDVDPDGVIRKLLRTPEGCTLLIQEWTALKESQDRYNTLVWSRRERLFHLLGKRLEDFFNGDRVINDWVVALLGSVFGDFGEAKVQSLSALLIGLRPEWMDDLEFAKRMAHLARQLPDVATATDRIRTYIDDTLAELDEWLEQAESNAEYLLELDHQAAWVDDTPEGSRRLNYKLGHGRSFDAACRRLEALQKDCPAEGKSKGAEPSGKCQAVTEPGPAVDMMTEPIVTNDPSLPETADGAAPVTIPDTLGVANEGVVTITNDPIRGGFLATVTEPDTLGAANGGVVTITNDPIRDSILPMVTASPGHDPLIAETGRAPSAGDLPSGTAVDGASIDGWARTQGAPHSDPPVLLDLGTGAQRTGEPPPDRPPP